MIVSAAVSTTARSQASFSLSSLSAASSLDRAACSASAATSENVITTPSIRLSCVR